ncbi:MAG: hypothetical protein ACQETO_00145 [Pseudomonadota bacterium]
MKRSMPKNTLWLSLLSTLVPLMSHAQLESGPSTPVAQIPSADWVMPRTGYGQPDLQGTWFFGSRTPLQRPANLGLKKTYTTDEVAAVENRMLERNRMLDAPRDPDRGPPERGARIGMEADDEFLAHWQDAKLPKVGGEYRTSIIIDPPDGRVPVRANFQDHNARQRAAGLGTTDGPEGQPLSGRCLAFGSAIPSMTPIMMNANMQIVQNHDHVMIMTEMAHDARIIRLDDEHRNNGIPEWMGDSVGYWEGDTLVVHTRDFRPEQTFTRGVGISEQFEVVERFTLVDDNAIHYVFTATDPVAFTAPVVGERMLIRNSPEDRIFEFACHEGNRSLPSILLGARVQESRR